MRSRVVVAAVAVTALVGLAAVAVRVIGSSDAATTEIRVATDNPDPPEPAPLPATVRPLWTAVSAGTPPSGPVEGPTAVAAGPDRVAGLDPATGRERWSYRRGNARLCGWTARDGVVLALFAKSSGCRDLVGLDAATGSRRWYRTVEVTADAAALTSGSGVAIVTAGSRLIAVDPVGGLNRWTYAGDGCPLDPAVVGPAAAATVARCPGGQVRLVGHDRYEDKAAWTVPQPAGSDPRVVAAEAEIAVLTRAGGRPVLTGYESVAGKGGKLAGRRTGSVADARLAYDGGARIGGVSAGDVVVVWTGRAAVAVDGRTRAVLWSAPASGPPADPERAEGQLLLADSGRLTSRPVVEGRPVRTVAVGGGTVPAGAVLSRIGGLVVAAGADRLAAYG